MIRIELLTPLEQDHGQLGLAELQSQVSGLVQRVNVCVIHADCLLRVEQGSSVLAALLQNESDIPEAIVFDGEEFLRFVRDIVQHLRFQQFQEQSQRSLCVALALEVEGTHVLGAGDRLLEATKQD